MFLVPAFSLAALATVAHASQYPLTIVNNCSQDVFASTQTVVGQATDNVSLAAGQVDYLYASDDFEGYVRFDADYANGADTSGPTWNGSTPFTRAFLNNRPSNVSYSINLFFGYSVGLEISTPNDSCDDFTCNISDISQCPLPGPDNSCFSPCCDLEDECESGAFSNTPAASCNSSATALFYRSVCPNAAPDNAQNHNNFYTCASTNVTMTLCPGESSTQFQQ